MCHLTFLQKVIIFFFKDLWSKAETTSGLKPGTENKKKKFRKFTVFKPRQYDFWLYQPLLVGSAEQNFT